MSNNPEFILEQRTGQWSTEVVKTAESLEELRDFLDEKASTKEVATDGGHR